MLISYNWLKKHVHLPSSITPAEVAAKLKASTVEVENIEIQGKNLEQIVIGKIISAEKHPNADKLKVCMVDVGDEKLQIVCGGSNVVEGMLVALAKVGAKVQWHGEGELIELKPTAIRGVESAGMICASTEIGLGELFPLKEEKEILDLTGLALAKPGVPLAYALALDDAILEIDNKSLSNRPDLWGHYGMAREVAVLCNKKLLPYKTSTLKSGKDIKLSVTVEDSALCPRYMAVAVSGITVGPSSVALKKSLQTVGLRSINNIVDITNYVMMDLGQPMHAFDAAQVVDAGIVVRAAKDGEECVTLDEEQRTLRSSMLVIADSEKVLAVAGVMGGASSAITDQTTSVIFESANFNAVSIRNTSTALGLRSDSSARFEKSLDPNLSELALQKAVELVLQECPGAKVSSKEIDISKFHIKQGPISLDMNMLEKKIGVAIPKKEVVRILEQLGFEVKIKTDELSVKIPSWRATKDISIAEDLIEEIVRIYGYSNIPAQMPVFTIDAPEENIVRRLERDVKQVMAHSLKYTEVYNYSFVSKAQIDALGDDCARYIELDNPLSKEKPYLRRCLVLNLLENISTNQANNAVCAFFEIGKVFRNEESGLRAQTNGDNLLPGQDVWFTSVFSEKKNTAPFWQAKEVVEVLSNTLVSGLVLEKSEETRVGRHPARSASIMLDGHTVGFVYELHPQAAKNFGLENRVGVVKLNISMLASLSFVEKKYTPINPFPIAERDVALLVRKSVTHQDIMSALAGADPLLCAVKLFDVYQGAHIAADYKSMAYHFVYQNVERTLVTEEVDVVHEKIISLLKEKFGAEVR
jgi:phenylalanyl-tRNA synthetase beta chain